MLYFNYQNLSFGKKSQKNPVPKNEAEEKKNSFIQTIVPKP